MPPARGSARRSVTADESPTPSTGSAVCCCSAKKRLDDLGREKIMGYLAAGDPRGELQMTWHAAQAILELYEVDDYELAEEFIDELIRDMAEPTYPLEVRSLGKTLKRWRT